jgi:hypothetical protein
MQRIKSMGGDIYMADEVDARIAELEKALGRALQFVEVAIDWNFDDCEIDGKMIKSHKFKNEIRKVLRPSN